ncbi:MAG: apolipoprotein N-acyltransferase [Shimia sp.]
MWPQASALSPRRRLIAFALCGVVAGAGHPPLALPVLTLLGLWVALVLRPWAMPPRAALWAGWALGAGYFGVALHWIVEPFLVDIARHGWMAPFALILCAAGFGGFWAGAFWLGARLRGPVALVVAWALVEWLRGHVLSGFPWALPVYPMVEGWAYQPAAWIGPYGLTLALLGLLALCAWRPAVGAVGVGALVVAAHVPLPPVPPSDGPLVRVVQPNAPQDQKWDPALVPMFLERKLASSAAAPRPALVVWPEVSLPRWLSDAGPLLGDIAGTARTPVILGAQRREGRRVLNSAVMVGEGGGVAALYDKHHLVPFGEYMPLGNLFARFGIYGLAANEGFGFSPGPGPAVIDVPGIGPVQPLICYEGIFPHEVAPGPRPRALVLITNDAWFGQWGGPRQHLAQAQARAIEVGLPLVRSANTGVSAIIDARGRIVAALPLGRDGYAEAALPSALAPTFYARWRDLPFWIALALLSVVAFLHHRRHS